MAELHTIRISGIPNDLAKAAPVIPSPKPLDRLAHPYYSNLARVIEHKMPRTASPEMVRGIVRGHGISQEEQEHVGLERKLQAAGPFSAHSTVELGRQIPDAPVSRETLLAHIQDHLPKLYDNVKIDHSDTHRNDDDGEFFDDYDDARYGNYKTPGIRNYEEHVITSPSAGAFQSSHWHEPGVLFHYRLGQTQDAEGKNVTHVDEIQSDLHQAGREGGYARPNTGRIEDAFTPEHRAEYADLRQLYMINLLNAPPYNPDHLPWDEWAASDAGKARIAHDDARDRLARSIQDLENRYANVRTLHGDNMPPDAPFKKNWHEVAFKHALHTAAINGSDRMTWTTGDTQNDRYSLANHVDQLYYDPEIGYLYGEKGSERPFIQTDVEPHELPSYIGHELSQKLLDSQRRDGFHFLKRDDMVVGGHGMRGFYDRILPQYAQKLAKVYRTGVGMTTLEPHGVEYHKLDPDEREKYFPGVHYINLHPEMRHKLLTEGFPLWGDTDAATRKGVGDEDEFDLGELAGCRVRISKAVIEPSTDPDYRLHVSMESAPARSSTYLPGLHTAPYGQRMDYHKEIYNALFPNGKDNISQYFGLPQAHTIIGPGAYEEDGQLTNNPSTQMVMNIRLNGDQNGVHPDDRPKVEGLASLLGYLTHQDSIGYHKPFSTENNLEASNAYGVQLGRPISQHEMEGLYHRLSDYMGEHGVPALIASEDGFRALNFSELRHGEFIKHLHDAMHATFPADAHAHTWDFGSDGDLVGNNWKASRNGEDYVSRGIASLGPDVWKWLTGIYEPVLRKIEQKYARQYGWGDHDGGGHISRKSIAPEPAGSGIGLGGGEQQLQPTDGSIRIWRGPGDEGEVPGTVPREAQGRLTHDDTVPKSRYREKSGVTYVNGPARQIIWEHFNLPKHCGAFSASREGVIKYVNRIHLAADYPYNKLTDEQRSNYHHLGDELLTALSYNPASGLVVVPLTNIGKMLRYARHEDVHAGQNLMGDPYSIINRKQLMDLEQMPGWVRAEDILDRYGYTSRDAAREIPAYIAGNQHEQIGLKDDEAYDIIRAYSRHLADNHGQDAVRRIFRHAGEIAKRGMRDVIGKGLVRIYKGVYGNYGSSDYFDHDDNPPVDLGQRLRDAVIQKEGLTDNPIGSNWMLPDGRITGHRSSTTGEADATLGHEGQAENAYHAAGYPLPENPYHSFLHHAQMVRLFAYGNRLASPSLSAELPTNATRAHIAGVQRLANDVERRGGFFSYQFVPPGQVNADSYGGSAREFLHDSNSTRIRGDVSKGLFRISKAGYFDVSPITSEQSQKLRDALVAHSGVVFNRGPYQGNWVMPDGAMTGSTWWNHLSQALNAYKLAGMDQPDDYHHIIPHANVVRLTSDTNNVDKPCLGAQIPHTATPEQIATVHRFASNIQRRNPYGFSYEVMHPDDMSRPLSSGDSLREFIADPVIQGLRGTRKAVTGSDRVHDDVFKGLLRISKAAPEPVVVKPFYSNLRNVISRKMQGAAPAEQVTNMIRGAGISNDEMDAHRLDSILTPGAKVSKQALLDHIDANTPTFQYRKFGGPSWEGNPPAKWHTSYNGRKLYSPGMTRYTESLMQLYPRPPENKGSFMHAHWGGIEDVLLHTRTGESKDVEGNHVTHLDELQSDWHQQGRKWGYKTREAGLLLDRLKAEADAIHQERQNYYRDLYPIHRTWTEEQIRHYDDDLTARESRNDRELRALRKSMDHMPPEAPFKENWHELGFKHALRQAVQNGSTRLTWNFGDAHNDRYKLSNYIDTIGYHPHDPTTSGEQTTRIRAWKNGSLKYDRVHPNSDLEDVVGKGIAEQIKAGKGSIPESRSHRIQNPDSYREISGKSLDIGGGGNRRFYDTRLPSYASKLVGQYGGTSGVTKRLIGNAKGKDEIKDSELVGDPYGVLGTSHTAYQPYSTYVNEKLHNGGAYTIVGDGWHVRTNQDESKDWNRYSRSWHRAHGPAVTVSNRRVEIKRKNPITGEIEDRSVPVDDWRGKRIEEAVLNSGIIDGNLSVKKMTEPVHYMDISPKLRETILKEGLPLWGHSNAVKKAVEPAHDDDDDDDDDDDEWPSIPILSDPSLYMEPDRETGHALIRITKGLYEVPADGRPYNDAMVSPNRQVTLSNPMDQGPSLNRNYPPSQGDLNRIAFQQHGERPNYGDDILPTTANRHKKYNGGDYMDAALKDKSLMALRDEQGNPIIKPAPGKITDPAEIATLVQNGIDGKNWYREWSQHLDGLYPPDKDAHRNRQAKILWGIGGTNTSVLANLGLFSRYMSRLDAGLMNSLGQIQRLHDDKIQKGGANGEPNAPDVWSAVNGITPNSPKVNEYTAAILGDHDSGAGDEWIARALCGVDDSPIAAEYRRLTGLARRAHSDHQSNPDNPRLDYDQFQASLWIGYKRAVARHLNETANKIEGSSTDPRHTKMANNLRNSANAIMSDGRPDELFRQFGLKNEDGSFNPLPASPLHDIIARHEHTLHALRSDGTVQSDYVQKWPIEKGIGLVRGLLRTSPLRDEISITKGADGKTYVESHKEKLREALSHGIDNKQVFIKNRPGNNATDRHTIVLGEGKKTTGWLTKVNKAALEQHFMNNPQFLVDMQRAHVLLRSMAIAGKNADEAKLYGVKPQDTDPFAIRLADMHPWVQEVARRADAELGDAPRETPESIRKALDAYKNTQDKITKSATLCGSIRIVTENWQGGAIQGQGRGGEGGFLSSDHIRANKKASDALTKTVQYNRETGDWRTTDPINQPDPRSLRITRTDLPESAYIARSQMEQHGIDPVSSQYDAGSGAVHHVVYSNLHGLKSLRRDLMLQSALRNNIWDVASNIHRLAANPVGTGSGVSASSLPLNIGDDLPLYPTPEQQAQYDKVRKEAYLRGRYALQFVGHDGTLHVIHSMDPGDKIPEPGLTPGSDASVGRVTPIVLPDRVPSAAPAIVPQDVPDMTEERRGLKWRSENILTHPDQLPGGENGWTVVHGGKSRQAAVGLLPQVAQDSPLGKFARIVEVGRTSGNKPKPLHAIYIPNRDNTEGVLGPADPAGVAANVAQQNQDPNAFDRNRLSPEDQKAFDGMISGNLLGSVATDVERRKFREYAEKIFTPMMRPLDPPAIDEPQPQPVPIAAPGAVPRETDDTTTPAPTDPDDTTPAPGGPPYPPGSLIEPPIDSGGAPGSLIDNMRDEESEPADNNTDKWRKRLAAPSSYLTRNLEPVQPVGSDPLDSDRYDSEGNPIDAPEWMSSEYVRRGMQHPVLGKLKRADGSPLVQTAPMGYRDVSEAVRDINDGLILRDGGDYHADDWGRREIPQLLSEMFGGMGDRERRRATVFLGLGGNGLSFADNLRGFSKMWSWYKSGLLRSVKQAAMVHGGDYDDPSSHLTRPLGYRGNPTPQDLINATHGNMPDHYRFNVQAAKFMGDPDAVPIEDWMTRAFTGKDIEPTQSEHERIDAMARHAFHEWNQNPQNRNKKLGAGQLSDALWQGINRRVGDYHEALAEAIHKAVPGSIMPHYDQETGKLVAPPAESGSEQEIINGLMRNQKIKIDKGAASNPSKLARELGLTDPNGMLIPPKMSPIHEFAVKWEPLLHSLHGVDPQDSNPIIQPHKITTHNVNTGFGALSKIVRDAVAADPALQPYLHVIPGDNDTGTFVGDRKILRQLVSEQDRKNRVFVIGKKHHSAIDSETKIHLSPSVGEGSDEPNVDLNRLAESFRQNPDFGTDAAHAHQTMLALARSGSPGSSLAKRYLMQGEKPDRSEPLARQLADASEAMSSIFEHAHNLGYTSDKPIVLKKGDVHGKGQNIRISRIAGGGCETVSGDAQTGRVQGFERGLDGGPGDRSGDGQRGEGVGRGQRLRISNDGWSETNKGLLEPQYTPRSKAQWLAVDFDGTAAHYDGWKGSEHVGEPVKPMLDRMKRWLREGEDVRIFTSRANDPLAVSAIQAWCREHLGRILPVTNEKDEYMKRIYDDRATQVQRNTGRLIRITRHKHTESTMLPPPDPNRDEHPFVGQMIVHGVHILIENKKGDVRRSGVDEKGKPWRNVMGAHYGEIANTVAGDGDAVDVYVLDHPEEATHVYIVDQLHPDGHPNAGKFDEQKLICGALSEDEAKKFYMKQYDSPGFFGGIHAITVDRFQEMFRNGKKFNKITKAWDDGDRAIYPTPASLAFGRVSAHPDAKEYGRRIWFARRHLTDHINAIDPAATDAPERVESYETGPHPFGLGSIGSSLVTDLRTAYMMPREGESIHDARKRHSAERGERYVEYNNLDPDYQAAFNIVHHEHGFVGGDRSKYTGLRYNQAYLDAYPDYASSLAHFRSNGIHPDAARQILNRPMTTVDTPTPSHKGAILRISLPVSVS